jgi:hypothetical protein
MIFSVVQQRGGTSAHRQTGVTVGMTVGLQFYHFCRGSSSYYRMISVDFTFVEMIVFINEKRIRMNPSDTFLKIYRMRLINKTIKKTKQINQLLSFHDLVFFFVLVVITSIITASILPTAAPFSSPTRR